MHFNGRLNAQVESDIVGYQTLELTSGLNLLAVNFDNIAENATIQDVVQGDFVTGERLLFYSPTSGYTTYTYQTTVFTDETYTNIHDGAAWATGAGILATEVVNSGSAFWIDVKSDKSVTIAGKVKLSDQKIECRTGTNLVAVAFPISVDLNKDLQITGAVVGDQIMTYSPINGYTTYTYQSTLFTDNTYTSLYNGAGWGDKAGIVAKELIPAGSAFWVVAKGNLSIDVASPIK
ncbi:MAG: hypothetical protein IJV69_02660 [Kiritimatiellae bacterium]|nr:hypothetical protein [Kiritimatiellia bacterium]